MAKLIVKQKQKGKNMTWKKFWKRVNALLHDNRTVLREGEDIEDWEEAQRKQREEEAKRQKKEQEILATWFLRKEYLNAGWFKRLLLRLEFAFRHTRGESHIPQIPEHIRMEIARCLLPDIIAYYESEQGQREFEEWKQAQSIQDQTTMDGKESATRSQEKGKERGRVTSPRNSTI